jgi:hypothetical protein
MDLPQAVQRDAPASSAPHGLTYAAAAFPKLTIVLDARGEASDVSPADWSVIVRQPGRGPTLRLQGSDAAENATEVVAAVEAVWPDLGPDAANRLEST